jgi:Domain of unknown function (DUF4382)
MGITARSGLVLALFAAIALTACSNGGGGDGRSSGIDNSGIGGPGGPQNGTLSVLLTDAGIDVSEIWIQIDRINLKPVDGPALEFEFDPDLDVDLLTLTPDNAETLLDGVSVPAGDYEWLELVVNADFDNIADSYVIETLGGGQFELRVPSGSVRLVSGLTITANHETSLMIDWNARLGLVKPPGRPGYMLRPAFRVIDMTEFGTLSGTVAMDLITPATPENGCNADTEIDDADVGNVVYVFADNGATPDDIDGVDAETDPNVDPVATLDVAQNTDGDYVFSGMLTPGPYTVAFTCQAGNDDPLTDDNIDGDDTATMLFTGGVDIEIVDGEETVVDFTS